MSHWIPRLILYAIVLLLVSQLPGGLLYHLTLVIGYLGLLCIAGIFTAVLMSFVEEWYDR